MSVSRSRLLAAALACGLVTTLVGCNTDELPGAAPAPGSTDSAAATPEASESAEPEVPPVTVMSNVKRGAADVPVDTRLTLEADGGTLRKVNVTSPAGPVPGKMSGDDVTWVADGLLEPGTA